MELSRDDLVPRVQALSALAQLVFTITEVPGVQRARFEAGGKSVPLVDTNGQVLDRPLQRSDLDALSGPASD